MSSKNTERFWTGCAEKLSASTGLTIALYECLSLDRPNIAAGHDDVVEPDGLAVFPILFRRVAFVVAVVLEPEAIHFQIHVAAPADAGEFADQLSIHPHGLFAVGFVRGGR